MRQKLDDSRVALALALVGVMLLGYGLWRVEGISSNSRAAAENAREAATNARQTALGAQRLAHRLRTVARQNRRLSCAGGQVISFASTQRFPGEPRAHFRGRIAAYRFYLNLARRFDCRGEFGLNFQRTRGGGHQSPGHSGQRPGPGEPAPRPITQPLCNLLPNLCP